MKITSKINDNGMNISVLGKGYNIMYPKNFFNLSLKTKKSILDNIAYLKIAGYASFLREKFELNTSMPFLKSFFDRLAVLYNN